MTETYLFPDSPAGLRLAMELTLSLRSVGFTTRLMPTTMAGFRLHRLEATAPLRATRRERCPLNAR